MFLGPICARWLSAACVCLLACSSLFAESAGYFALTPTATLAYEQALSLRFDRARELLKQMEEQEPDNLFAAFVENYIDCLSIFITEDEEAFVRLEKNKAARLKQIAGGPTNSPYYYYIQAAIHLHWALTRLKFEEYVRAVREVRTAYKLLLKNQRLYPDFAANKTCLGILHGLAGTVPDNYKWGMKLLSGIDGSISRGRQELEVALQYAQQHQTYPFRQEAVAVYAYFLLHLANEGDKAWSLLQKHDLQPEKNPLACFLIANIASRTGRNAMAIEILENRPKTKACHPFFYLHYMLGDAKLRALDTSAITHLKYFTQHFGGQSYLKQAHQRMAWYHLLHGNDMAAYRAAMQKCVSEGATVTGGDKNALKEATAEHPPHPVLLKARLLFDGGYYQTAYECLHTAGSDVFSLANEQLEYTYRLGRTAHRLGHIAEARRYYDAVIQTGRYQSHYYACNAALQAGLMYEQQAQNSEARQYYRLCLGIYPSEYQRSLHQKAKAGLQRLK